MFKAKTGTKRLMGGCTPSPGFDLPLIVKSRENLCLSDGNNKGADPPVRLHRLICVFVIHGYIRF